MKHITCLFLMFNFYACTDFHSPENVDSNKETIHTNNVRLVFIADRSTSFIRKYSFPAPLLFKPLCDKITSQSTLDFRYCCVFGNSDIECNRYYKPYTTTTAQTKASNPWLNTEKGNRPIQAGTDWNEFVLSVQQRLSQAPSTSSDISSAINHALISFQERSTDSNIRNILIICSDLKDSYHPIPAIPNTIEVICIGGLPQTSVEQTLHTPVKRFENLNAGLEYLITTF